MSEWQPIETAKKEDFVRILAAGPHRRADCGDPFVVDIIFWTFRTEVREVDVGGGLYRKDRVRTHEGWCRFGDHGERPLDFEPTHWMPLPPPPSEERPSHHDTRQP